MYRVRLAGTVGAVAVCFAGTFGAVVDVDELLTARGLGKASTIMREAAVQSAVGSLTSGDVLLLSRQTATGDMQSRAGR